MKASNMEAAKAESIAHIEAARREGVSLSIYARRHGISVERLYRVGARIRRLNAPAGETVTCKAKVTMQSETPFAQVQVRSSQCARLLAQLPNGVTLELEYSASDISLALALINTLARCDVPA